MGELIAQEVVNIYKPSQMIDIAYRYSDNDDEKKLNNKKSVLLAGDFNINPNTKTISQIENVLESVFKNELKTSFNIARKDLVKDPGYATSAVDMMFVSLDIRVLSHDCPNVDVSDHLPLVVEVEV